MVISAHFELSIMHKFSAVLLQVNKQHETGQVKPDCSLPHTVRPIQARRTLWGAELINTLHQQHPQGLEASKLASERMLGMAAQGGSPRCLMGLSYILLLLFYLFI